MCVHENLSPCKSLFFSNLPDGLSLLRIEVRELRDLVEQQTVLLQHLVTKDNPAEAAESVGTLLPKPVDLLSELLELDKQCESKEFRLKMVSFPSNLCDYH